MHPDNNKKLAFWSGPRNISTAMMYSFAQRSDTTVVDEPFYAAYLAETGIKHPMYQEIITNGEVDPAKVINYCCGENPESKPLFYQKQMTKHMIPSFGREWVHQVTNIFLIRDPARVIASYHIKDENPELTDIGIKEQLELFEKVSEKLGSPAIVMDSADLLADPENMLKHLCDVIGIKFQTSMLSWPKGPRHFDGVWAPHWYGSVWKSSGFSKPATHSVDIPEHLLALLEISNNYYDRIKKYRISVDMT
ncbi:MAG: HAD family hydrolase [Gammaproteobacteria bacterium]|nr:HAD family hydrolase [Gammaproteobacteria bacterium]